MEFLISPTGGLRGEIRIPGDKSISHRAVMLGSIATGETVIDNFLPGADCLSTIACFRKLGVFIDDFADGSVIVQGKGLGGLVEPEGVLNAGNSGTTLRLLLGILAGQDFFSIIDGDSSLRRRPMARVTQPLIRMGAQILGRQEAGMAPLAIKGGDLRPIDFASPVASAQVKSAVLLAGLYAYGPTTITEPSPSRDHTERMLKYFGAQIDIAGSTVYLQGHPLLQGKRVTVPGDISSAAFFLVAASIVPESDLILRGIGINNTRSGILDVLLEMGADIELFNQRETGEEPIADIRVRYAGALKGVRVGGATIPRLIDEIPALAVAAALAQGDTVIRDAEELKVKESNRIATVAVLLNEFGARVEELPDGLLIHGVSNMQAATCDSHGDHRIAMAAVVAGLVAQGKTLVRDVECIEVSFPGFKEIIDSIGGYKG